MAATSRGKAVATRYSPIRLQVPLKLFRAIPKSQTYLYAKFVGTCLFRKLAERIRAFKHRHSAAGAKGASWQTEKGENARIDLEFEIGKAAISDGSS